MTTLLSLLRSAFQACPEPVPAPPAVLLPGFAIPANLVLATESQLAWQTHLNDYMDAFAPANYPETEAVQQLAGLTWRLARLTATETALLNASQPVPVSLYQAIATLQAGYQIALDSLAKLPPLTKLPAQTSEPSNNKVVILVKQPEVKRAAPAPNSASR